jgi:hypothetical protein
MKEARKKTGELIWMKLMKSTGEEEEEEQREEHKRNNCLTL